MNNNSLLKDDLSALSMRIRNKEISPKEIVQELLSRIEQINPIINAYISVAGDEAIKQSIKAETEIMAGQYRGPLHGIPIGLKDLIYTKGIRTTMGSEIHQNFIPNIDATVARKLKRAGALLIGKQNMHEFAYGSTGEISYFGTVRNPYDTSKMSGGSSSGSAAAVASALCFGAVGTDTGGSIRIPASACGIVGMKPTFGRVSKYGVYPLGPSLDHVGPLTRSVRDNAMMLSIMTGYDRKDPYSRKQAAEDFTRYLGNTLQGKVIGISNTFYFDDLADEVQSKLEDAIGLFRGMGAEIKRVDIPALEEVSWAQLKTLQSEAYAIHQEQLDCFSKKYQPMVLERFMACTEARGYEYVRAQEIRKRIIASFQRVFRSVDVLLAPTIPIIPPDIGQQEIEIKGKPECVRSALLRLTGPANLTGLPSLSIPCGFSSGGLPIGMQLIGNHFNEALLYQFGDCFEKEVSLSALKWKMEK